MPRSAAEQLGAEPQQTLETNQAEDVQAVRANAVQEAEIALGAVATVVAEQRLRLQALEGAVRSDRHVTSTVSGLIFIGGQVEAQQAEVRRI